MAIIESSYTAREMEMDSLNAGVPYNALMSIQNKTDDDPLNVIKAAKEFLDCFTLVVDDLSRNGVRGEYRKEMGGCGKKY